MLPPPLPFTFPFVVHVRYLDRPPLVVGDDRVADLVMLWVAVWGGAVWWSLASVLSFLCQRPTGVLRIGERPRIEGAPDVRWCTSSSPMRRAVEAASRSSSMPAAAWT